MARSRNGYKSYRPGDPIHIVVTQDFVEDANRFFSYCREKGFNPSQIIRQAMVDWLDKEENQAMAPQEQPLLETDFDDKIMDLVRDRKKTRTRMSLRTVKELLEEA